MHQSLLKSITVLSINLTITVSSSAIIKMHLRFSVSDKSARVSVCSLLPLAPFSSSALWLYLSLGRSSTFSWKHITLDASAL